LEDSIPILKEEITALLPDDRTQLSPPVPSLPVWCSHSLWLLGGAGEACEDKNVDLGWRCFMAAERFSLFGLSPGGLKARAEALLHEIEQEDKGLSDWR